MGKSAVLQNGRTSAKGHLMRILMANYEFPPLGGGAGRATYNIAKGLVQRGHDVHLLISKWGGNQPWVVDGAHTHAVEVPRKGIHNCGLRGAGAYVLKSQRLMNRLCSEQTFDISHSFFSMPTGILSYQLKRKNSIPYVISLRGSDVPGYDPCESQLMHKITLPMTRKIWKNADRVVALSKGLREQAHQTYPDLNIEVIPNGIDTTEFQSNVNYENRPFPPIRIITVSRLIRRKGIDTLIRALHNLQRDDVTLTVVGDGDCKENLQKNADALGISDRVEFTGYVPSQNLPEICSQHHIFALPSLAESFGMVFVEAMACELPVIGCRVGGVPEIIRDHTDGLLVDAGDTNALQTALSTLIDSPERRRNMAASALDRVKSSFTWDAVVEAYLDIYTAITTN